VYTSFHSLAHACGYKTPSTNKDIAVILNTGPPCDGRRSFRHGIERDVTRSTASTAGFATASLSTSPERHVAAAAAAWRIDRNVQKSEGCSIRKRKGQDGVRAHHPLATVGTFRSKRGRAATMEGSRARARAWHQAALTAAAAQARHGRGRRLSRARQRPAVGSASPSHTPTPRAAASGHPRRTKAH